VGTRKPGGEGANARGFNLPRRRAVRAAILAARLLVMACATLGRGCSQGEEGSATLGWSVTGWSMDRWLASREQSGGSAVQMEVRSNGASLGPRYRGAGLRRLAGGRPAAVHNRLCSLHAARNHFSTVTFCGLPSARIKAWEASRTQSFSVQRPRRSSFPQMGEGH
jgi:hypothetical protein